MSRLPPTLASFALAPELRALIVDEIQRARDEAFAEGFGARLARLEGRTPRPLKELGPGSRVALYLRVSTDEQDVALQERELSQLVAARGYVVAKRYTDEGISAGDRRPALRSMMRDAGRHRFDAIVVWKTDRFYRDTLRFLLAMDELAKLGVHFVSLTENWDTSTPEGELLQTLCAAVARMENRRHAQRVKAGIAARIAQGLPFGRAALLTAETLELALQLQREGRSTRAIAAELTARGAAVSKDTVARALRAAAAASSSSSSSESPRSEGQRDQAGREEERDTDTDLPPERDDRT